MARVTPPRTSKAVRAHEAGWPRPLHEWRAGPEYRRCQDDLPARLPVPWINGPCVADHNDWHAFRPNALPVMRMGRLCLICGKRVDGPIYLPAQGNPRDGRFTSGGGGHARCVLLAVKRCPHMVERDYAVDDVVGWRWDGLGLGILTANASGDHGDHDEVHPDAVEITLAELRAVA